MERKAIHLPVIPSWTSKAAAAALLSELLVVKHRFLAFS